MSADVLLNLLNVLGKVISARIAEHFITFYIVFDKFNNAEALMLDSIFHMTLKLL